jgi:hypothetical protein
MKGDVGRRGEDHQSREEHLDKDRKDEQPSDEEVGKPEDSRGAAHRPRSGLSPFGHAAARHRLNLTLSVSATAHVAQRPRTCWKPSMSMNPWPEMLKAITFRSFASLHCRASSIAQATLYALSGAGRNPSDCTNMRARSNT